MGTLADRIGTSYDRKIVRPRNGVRAAYTQHINVGETIWAAGTRQFRVADVVPVNDEDSPLRRDTDSGGRVEKKRASRGALFGRRHG